MRRIIPIGLIAASIFLAGCEVFSEVTRAIAEACGRPSILVTTTADLRTPCSGDECSLWGAIALANTCNNGMVVELQEGGRYLIGVAPASTAETYAIFPVVTSRVTVAGNGAEIARVIREPFERFFDIRSDGDLTLTDLGLQGGGSSSTVGFRVAGGSFRGGAIVNEGTLTLEDVRTVDNRSLSSGGAIWNSGRLLVRGGSHMRNRTGGSCETNGGGFLINKGSGSAIIESAVFEENRGSCGGAIYNEGMLVVINSTFRGNWAGLETDNEYSGMGGALDNDSFGDTEPVAMISGSTFTSNQARIGGAVRNEANARMTVHNSTFSGNNTYTPCPDCDVPARHLAAGILNHGSLTLRDVTIVSNSCNGPAPCVGGLMNRWGTVAVQNSIIAQNAGGDCDHEKSSTARFTASGASLDSDSTCPGFSIHASPRLGPLQDNGGLTPTHGIAPGSPAHDAGTSCFVVDQRGHPRVRSESDPCDIGAFEL